MERVIARGQLQSERTVLTGRVRVFALIIADSGAVDSQDIYPGDGFPGLCVNDAAFDESIWPGRAYQKDKNKAGKKNGSQCQNNEYRRYLFFLFSNLFSSEPSE